MNKKKVKLTSGKIMICDSSNIAYWLSHAKDTNELFWNRYINESLHEKLKNEGKEEAVLLQEMVPYLLKSDMPYYEIYEEMGLGVYVDCQKDEVEIWKESDDSFVIELSEGESEQVLPLGYVSIDGAHFIVTDLENINEKEFGYSGRKDSNDEFFKSEKGYFSWLGDGLCRVDGHYTSGKLSKILVHSLPRCGGEFDMDYGL